jgi:small basic protein
MVPVLAKRLLSICAFLIGIFWIVITSGTLHRSALLYISSLVVVCLGSLYMLFLCIYPVQQRKLQWGGIGAFLGIIVGLLVQLTNHNTSMYYLPLAFLGFLLGCVIDEVKRRHTGYSPQN